MRTSAAVARRYASKILRLWKNYGLADIDEIIGYTINAKHIEQVIRLGRIGPARVYLETVLKGKKS